VPAKRPELAVVPPAPNPRESEAWRWFDASSAALEPAPLDQSPRARNIREINRIASRYTWGEAVKRILDKFGVTAVWVLSDDQVDELLARMRHLVDCAETGCDADDDLPAR